MTKWTSWYSFAIFFNLNCLISDIILKPVLISREVFRCTQFYNENVNSVICFPTNLWGFRGGKVWKWTFEPIFGQNQCKNGTRDSSSFETSVLLCKQKKENVTFAFKVLLQSADTCDQPEFFKEKSLKMCMASIQTFRKIKTWTYWKIIWFYQLLSGILFA